MTAEVFNLTTRRQSPLGRAIIGISKVRGLGYLSTFSNTVVYNPSVDRCKRPRENLAMASRKVSKGHYAQLPLRCRRLCYATETLPSRIIHACVQESRGQSAFTQSFVNLKDKDWGDETITIFFE